MEPRVLASCVWLPVWATLLVALPPPAEAAISVDWVQIGTLGNACDTQSQGCFGAVASAYAISKYEVTNAQYTDFLNAVADADPNFLYNGNMALSQGGITRSGSSGSYSYATIAGRASKAVNYISWYDAARFVNWLENGEPTGAQGVGTTETGTYTLSLATPVRVGGARIFLPTEDEWYKAAYFDPALGLYYDYPAGTDTPTVCAAPTATANRAKCNFGAGNLPEDVGSYTGSPSPFGTFDQGGNVGGEWSETPISSSRIARGGGWFDSAVNLAAATRNSAFPTIENAITGFRIAAVPEPATGLLVMAGLLGLGRWRRRRV